MVAIMNKAQREMEMHDLSTRDAIEIAADYGLPYQQFKRTIRENLEQARRYHLTQRPYGNPPLTARQYFDGYMASTAHEMNCDARAHADFCDRAYGDD
jgi:hypothetical protein